MFRLRMRPTGISLLVGLIDLQPGSFDYYTSALDPLLKEWGEPWRKRILVNPPDISRSFDPRQCYLASCFVGLGTWDLVTLTLMSEKGLAAHLSFIGHVRGQNYFHAQDYSLVLDPSGLSSNSPILKALKKLSKIASHLGITDLVKLNDPSVCKEWIINGEERLPIDDKLDYFAAWRPLSLDATNGGVDSLLGGCDHFLPGITDRKKELLGIFQLKLNQTLALRHSEWANKVVFLLILGEFAKIKKSGAKWEQTSKEDPQTIFGREDVFPSVVRPMFCDGYFDLIILMRGRYLHSMDYLMQQIKYRTVRDAITGLSNMGLLILIGEQLPYELEDEPLFELSHSTIGFSQAIHADLLNHEKDIKELAGDGSVHFVQTDQQQTVKKFHEAYKVEFEAFNKPEGASPSLFQLKPSTLVAVNASRLVRTLADIRHIQSILNPPSSKQNILYGSYDFELFPHKRPFLFGDFLATLQLYKHLLLRDTLNIDADDSGSLFKERLQSPLLSLYSQLGFSSYEISNRRLRRLELRYLNDKRELQAFRHRKSFQRSLCLISSASIIKALDSIQASLEPRKEELTASWEKFEQSRAFWMTHIAKLEGERPSQGASKTALQAVLYQFLKMRFSLDVSPETIESLFSTFCAVDGYLSDPLRFYIFLDLRRYMEHLFKVLLTIQSETADRSSTSIDESPATDYDAIAAQTYMYNNDPSDEEEEAIAIGHTDILKEMLLDNEDPNSEEAFECPGENDQDGTGFFYFEPEQETMVIDTFLAEEGAGIEALLLSQINLIHLVTNQRSQGSFPHHDRSYSRLADLRTFHTKKIISVSWMVANLIRLTNRAVHQSSAIRFGTILRRVLPARLAHQPRLDLFIREKLPTSTYLAQFCNSPEALTRSGDRSVSLNARHLTSIESMVLLFHEMGHIYAKGLKDHPSPKLFNKHGSHQWQFKLNYVWEEVFADLFAYKFCFAPLDNPALFKLQNQINTDFVRVRHLPVADNEVDLPDMFLLAWIVQLLGMPKVRRKVSFDSLIYRMFTVQALLKFFRYPTQFKLKARPKNFGRDEMRPKKLRIMAARYSRLFEQIFNEAKIEAFFCDKLPFLLKSLQEGEGDDPFKKINLNESIWVDQFVVPKQETVKKTIAEAGRHCKNQFIRFMFNLPFHPACQFMAFLAAPYPSGLKKDNAWFKTMLFETKPKDPNAHYEPIKIWEGILEFYKDYKKPEDFLAASAQLAGLASLALAHNARGRTVFTDGYPGFDRFGSQQNLARTRQLVIKLLMYGSSLETRRSLDEEGLL